MKLNRKGEVITVGLIGAAIVIGLLGFIAGSTGIRKWVPGLGGNDNKTKQVSITKSESKPIFVTGQDGKQYVLQSTTTSTSTSESSEEQKMTFWQKLKRLGFLWILLTVIGFCFTPLGAVMTVVNGRLKGEIKKIVGGVEASLEKINPDEKKKVLDTLSMKFDSSTKKLVADTKRKL